MELITNTPEPVEPPPTTYDLVGLSRDQAELIFALVGAVNLGDLRDLGLREANGEVYQALSEVFPIFESGRTVDIYGSEGMVRARRPWDYRD